MHVTDSIALCLLWSHFLALPTHVATTKFSSSPIFKIVKIHNFPMTVIWILLLFAVHALETFPYGKLVKVIRVLVVNDMERLHSFKSQESMESDSNFILSVSSQYFDRFSVLDTYSIELRVASQITVAISGADSLSRIQQFRSWVKASVLILPAFDMALLLSGASNTDNSIGRAYVQAICTDSSVALVYVTGQLTTIAAKLVAHETGHVLGMLHDDELDDVTCSLKSNTFMWTTVSTADGTQWSQCSADAFDTVVHTRKALCLEFDADSDISKTLAPNPNFPDYSNSGVAVVPWVIWSIALFIL